jgi:hypothetical protein
MACAVASRTLLPTTATAASRTRMAVSLPESLLSATRAEPPLTVIPNRWLPLTVVSSTRVGLAVSTSTMPSTFSATRVSAIVTKLPSTTRMPALPFCRRTPPVIST